MIKWLGAAALVERLRPQDSHVLFVQCCTLCPCSSYWMSELELWLSPVMLSQACRVSCSHCLRLSLCLIVSVRLSLHGIYCMFRHYFTTVVSTFLFILLSPETGPLCYYEDVLWGGGLTNGGGGEGKGWEHCVHVPSSLWSVLWLWKATSIVGWHKLRGGGGRWTMDVRGQLSRDEVCLLMTIGCQWAAITGSSAGKWSCPRD